jgi:hypothetical protein
MRGRTGIGRRFLVPAKNTIQGSFVLPTDPQAIEELGVAAGVKRELVRACLAEPEGIPDRTKRIWAEKTGLLPKRKFGTVLDRDTQIYEIAVQESDDLFRA